MIRTDRLGYACALAMRGRADSAAAPAARCRKFRRGSFIWHLPSSPTYGPHIGRYRNLPRFFAHPSLNLLGQFGSKRNSLFVIVLLGIWLMLRKIDWGSEVGRRIKLRDLHVF